MEIRMLWLVLKILSQKKEAWSITRKGGMQPVEKLV
jgi:hypothetical protein